MGSVARGAAEAMLADVQSVQRPGSRIAEEAAGDKVGVVRAAGVVDRVLVAVVAQTVRIRRGDAEIRLAQDRRLAGYVRAVDGRSGLGHAVTVDA